MYSSLTLNRLDECRKERMGDLQCTVCGSLLRLKKSVHHPTAISSI